MRSRDGVEEPADHQEQDWKGTLIYRGAGYRELTEVQHYESPVPKKMMIEGGLVVRRKRRETKKSPVPQG